MANVFIDLVREYFPEADDEAALAILWEYTGYPSFWGGDPVTRCREQLAYLKEVGPQRVDEELEAVPDAFAS